MSGTDPTSPDGPEERSHGPGQREGPASGPTPEPASGKHTGREAPGSESRSASVSHLDEKRSGRRPEGPPHPRKGGLGQTLKRTVSEFKEDNLSDSAAALTYFAVLSIFPALIALFSLVSLVMSPKKIISAGTDLVSSIGPASAVNTLKGPINDLAASTEAAGVLLVVGVAAALWSASAYVGAFMRASNVIYEVEEGRPFIKLRPLQMLVTLVLVLLQAVVLIALVVSGPLATKAGSVIGAGDSAVTAWNYAKWPVLLLVVVLMFCVLYYASPNARLSGLKSVIPGAVLALAIWLVASVGFAAYVVNFGSYNKTYGALAGVIVFLVWLWITNLAILLGAEFNAERERSREIAAGTRGAERELQLDERSRPKRKKRSRTA
ncbi:YihY/virulence factor BrkB family protein [Streptomyces bathyalis]|uniref:YihY/virulence factor BrkB family protein n=1 Tax=Streptomyces bathyalis TaxID=2710756 RepID=A0A7T1T6X8_9ACTN|nr:YihY/virulence factor BrkB family protein [Streptomyces bathyalis]QPP07514.1 YihY/virulence factor BrkB family protein [Streptomyces bathyalis]